MSWSARSTATSKPLRCICCQLVDQHIARGADFALEAEAAAQQEGLAEGAAVGELGEVQVDAVDAVKSDSQRIGVIRQLQECHFRPVAGVICCAEQLLIS